MNIVDPILFQCRFHPAGAAIVVPGAQLERISYGRLERLIHNASGLAHSAGLIRGDVAAIFVDDKILHAAIVLGFARLGILTLQSGSIEFPKELKVSAIVTQRKIPGIILDKKIVIVDPASLLEGEGKPLPDPRLYATRPDDPCRIVMTSGTTGEPRGVALSHALLAARMARHAYMMGNILPACQRLYCDFSFNTSLGIQFLFYVLSRGGTLFLHSGADLGNTIQGFGLYRVEAMIGSPAALAGFTNAYENTPSLQASLKVAIVGGSQLMPALAARATARFCSNVVSAYGASEASMIATAPAQAIAETPGAVGFVLPDLAVEIVDASGALLAPGEEGTIRIRGPYGVSSYVGREGEPNSRFRDGYFYPGDLGRVTKDGLLIVGGREQAIINVGGDKINPEKVEAVLASFPGIEQAGVFTSPNEFGIALLSAVLVSKRPLDHAALEAFCKSRLAPAFVPKQFVQADSLPVNETGKLDRSKLQRPQHGN